MEIKELSESAADLIDLTHPETVREELFGFSPTTDWIAIKVQSDNSLWLSFVIGFAIARKFQNAGKLDALKLTAVEGLVLGCVAGDTGVDVDEDEANMYVHVSELRTKLQWLNQQGHSMLHTAIDLIRYDVATGPWKINPKG